jgi:2-oxo-4-hydroxy-4-carboxy-5-ureidoimidazoline decarboxylase
MSYSEAVRSFRRCCGAQKWIEKMIGERPFVSITELFEKADRFWAEMGKEDILEAFTHHPKIGDLDNLKKKFNITAQWEMGEQAGVAAANDQVITDLAKGNDDYEKKFGYIFIVCATGKSAEEMLSILQSRLPNDPATELKASAEEQRKITRLRLEKLCQE